MGNNTSTSFKDTLGSGDSVRADIPEKSIKTDSTTPAPQVEKKSDSQSPPQGAVSMEKMHERAKDILCQPFEGAKFVVQKGLTSHFQTSHTLSITSRETPGYKFGLTYVGTQKVSDTESYPIVLGELSPSGALNAQIIHQFLPFWRTRYVTQLAMDKIVGQQLHNEFNGQTWQIGLNIVNPDVGFKRYMALVDATKQINDNWTIGAMYLHQKSPMVPGGSLGVLSFGGRYVAPGDKWRLAITTSPHNLSAHLSFHMKLNDALQIVSELESDVRTESNVATVGYQYNIDKSNVTFKAQIDTEWTIAAVMEKRLLPTPFTFCLSACGNHVSSKFSFGIGLTLG